jgi:nitric oxide reductase activation protein
MMDCVNALATAFYTVHPDIHDVVIDKTKNNSGLGPQILAEGNRYFAGTEAKIRKLLVDERAPKVRDSLRNGKKLDINHLYRHEELKRGKMPHIWKTIQEGTRIDTAVFIGLDESGSMCGDNWWTTIRITAALTKILDSLSAKYMVVGFSSLDSNYSSVACQRASTVKFTVHNKWGSRLDPNNFDGNPAGGNTPTADIVTVGLQELARRQEVRKVFIMLTDGAPNYDDQDTNVAAVKMAGERLDIARKCGVKTFAFGLDITEHQCSDVMKKMFNGGWVNLPHFSNDAAKHASTIIQKLEEAFHG